MTRQVSPRHATLVLLATLTCATIGSAGDIDRPLRCRFSGVLGQSQSPTASPLPTIGFDGVVATSNDRLYAAAANKLFVLTRVEGHEWALAKQSTLPVRIHPDMGLRFDGRRAYFVGDDCRVYTFTPGADADGHGDIKIHPLGGMLPAARSYAVAPHALSHSDMANGNADTKAKAEAEAKVVYLAGNTVRALARNGSDLGVVLTLPTLPEQNWKYTAVGIEPTTGDLLVASDWPDSKIYRFDASGRSITRDGWPRECFARHIITIDNQAWAITNGGAARLTSSVPTSQPSSAGGVFVHYTTGVARSAAGEFFLAGSQGIVLCDVDGRALSRRFGGIVGVRSLAAADDGTLIVAVENGQRMIRLNIDDRPDSPLKCDADDPWRAGGNWSSHASAIDYDGRTFIVADPTSRRLWRFDPWHMGWQQTPWLPLTATNAFADPRALAIGNMYLWVLDQKTIIEIQRRDFTQTKNISLARFDASEEIRHIAATDDDTLVVATKRHLSAYAFANDSARTNARIWHSADVFKDISALAAGNECVAVVDSGASQIVLIDLCTGRRITKITAADVPGGMQPACATMIGNWLIVEDRSRDRLLRFKCERR